MRYLMVEPPSHRYRVEDIVYVDLVAFPLTGLALADRLNGEPLTHEDLFNEGIANCPDPGTEKGREEATNRIHEECGEKLCELLNFVLQATGAAVSESSVFTLVAMIDDREDCDEGGSD